MQFKSLSVLGLLGLASALTMAPRAGGPTVTTGKAFNLAVWGDLSELDPEHNAWVFSANRYTQARYNAIASPRNADKTQNPVFYLNSTKGEPQTMVSDIPGVFPLSAYVAAKDDFNPRYPKEHDVSLGVGGGTVGMYYHYNGYGVPVLGGPTLGGWAVCPRTSIYPGGPGDVMAIRWLYADEAVPEDCVAVQFVLMCADLPELPPDSAWNHDFVSDVDCVAQ